MKGNPGILPLRLTQAATGMAVSGIPMIKEINWPPWMKPL
jgi:hypothetical protein